MRTLAIIVPPDAEYGQQIHRGALREVERCGGWQVVDLPYRPSGAVPARRGMRSLDGVISWVDRRHSWLPELAARGVPVVNCGGDWQATPGVATIAVDMDSVLELAISHIADLGISGLYFFGHRVSKSEPRLAMLSAIEGKAAALGISTSFLETGGRSPDEDLSRLLAPDKEAKLREQFGALPGGLGLFCENDHFGRLACNVAGLAGLRVPNDMAVLGAGDSLIGRYGEPTVSTVAFPGEEIGGRAFRLIVDAGEGGELPSEKLQVVAHELIVRESTGGKARDVALERVHRRIEVEALLGLTFGELMEGAGLSAKVLRSRYGKIYGEEPSEHIRRLRLREAKRLLADTDQSVADVAAACGFSSQAGFYNFFQRHTGEAPMSYRRGLSLR